MTAAPAGEAGREGLGERHRVASSEPIDLPLALLNVQDEEYAVRVDGLDQDQIAQIARVDEPAPILVEATTMRVIDGRHRIAAARRLGRETISACVLEGPSNELFRLAVVLNATHGLPLTLADRRAAAAGLLRRSMDRSDRSIARDVGLAAATVARIRRSSTAQDEQLNVRRGRDGRWRATSVGAGKAQARALLTEHPEITLREVARMSGISLGTACNVRAAILRDGTQNVPGVLVVPGAHGAARDEAAQGEAQAPPTQRVAPDAETLRLLSRLVRDPALCRTERGREVLARLRGLVLQPEDGERFALAVPPHQLLETIAIVRASARSWITLANSLQEQSELPFQQTRSQNDTLAD